VDPGAFKAIDRLRPYNVLPESPADADLWHRHRLDIVDTLHGAVACLAAPRGGDVGRAGGKGQLVIERFVDDRAHYGFEPDRPSDTRDGGAVHERGTAISGLPFGR
jgi:hypothetical protein